MMAAERIADAIERSLAGGFSREQLAHLARTELGLQLSDEALDAIFRQLDANGDGVVTAAEFRAVFNAYLTGQQHVPAHAATLDGPTAAESGPGQAVSGAGAVARTGDRRAGDCDPDASYEAAGDAAAIPACQTVRRSLVYACGPDEGGSAAAPPSAGADVASTPSASSDAIRMRMHAMGDVAAVLEAQNAQLVEELQRGEQRLRELSHDRETLRALQAREAEWLEESARLQAENAALLAQLARLSARAQQLELDNASLRNQAVSLPVPRRTSDSADGAVDGLSAVAERPAAPCAAVAVAGAPLRAEALAGDRPVSVAAETVTDGAGSCAELEQTVAELNASLSVLREENSRLAMRLNELVMEIQVLRRNAAQRRSEVEAPAKTSFMGEIEDLVRQRLLQEANPSGGQSRQDCEAAVTSGRRLIERHNSMRQTGAAMGLTLGAQPPSRLPVAQVAVHADRVVSAAPRPVAADASGASGALGLRGLILRVLHDHLGRMAPACTTAKPQRPDGPAALFLLHDERAQCQLGTRDAQPSHRAAFLELEDLRAVATVLSGLVDDASSRLMEALEIRDRLLSENDFRHMLVRELLFAVMNAPEALRRGVSGPTTPTRSPTGRQAPHSTALFSFLRGPRRTSAEE